MEFGFDVAFQNPARAVTIGDFHAEPTTLAHRVLGNRYRIAGQIGSGGTADVYLAEDLVTRRLVVVKRLSRQAAEAPELVERFLREALIARAVDHPSVVRVLEVAHSDLEGPYFVMEALAGETLGDCLRREERVSEERARCWLGQAAAGLRAVHRAGIVHRDVKPDNLFLLGPAGDPWGLKLIDFGMAKLLARPRTTPSNFVVGTAQYMAPEQILGETVDARTDIYALGVVAFRMLTGQLPFDTAPGATLLSHQLFSPVPPPSWLLDGLDPDLEAVVLRAVSKHPDNRYPSVDELLGDLETLMGLGPMGGRLFALGARPRAADVYIPQTSRGQDAARALALAYGASARDLFAPAV
jgi:eukaryotic-like serine/threonine-protein kinase